MDDGKKPFLLTYFNQIEAQIVFGDSKASLLIAGDSILLAIAGSLVNTVSSCQGKAFSVSCLVFSPSLMLAVMSMASLVIALAHALRAARPASIHVRPRPEFFLISYVAQVPRDEFVGSFNKATLGDLEQWALETIHGKATYATGKFRLLRRAVDATLISLGLLVCAALSAPITWRL